jgi:hypothetical protein
MADQTKTILIDVDVDASKAEGGASKARAALASLGDGLGRAREKGNELADELELVGIAAGTVAAVIGGTLVGAISKFIEQDKKAADSVESLGKAFDELLFTLGNAILGGDNFAKTTDKVTGAVKDLTTEIDNNRGQIFEFAKGTVTALSYVVEYMLKAVLGVQIFIQAVVDAIQEAVRLGIAGFINLAEGLADLLGVKLGDNHYALKLSLEVEGQNRFRETIALAERLDELSAGFEGAREFVGGLGTGPGSTPVGSAKGRRRVGVGGGVGAEADTLDFTEAEGLATLFQLQAEGGAPGATGAAAGAGGLGSVTQDVGQLTSATDDLTASLAGADVAGARLTENMAAGFDSLTTSAVSLGVALADSLVSAFVQGEASVEKWVGTALEGIGQIALNFGQAAILAGAVSNAVPFFGLSGGVAIAAGAALVALGLGLKAGGAALASGGGEGGGAVGAGSSAPVPRPPALRQTDDRETTIVLEIDGQRIGRAMAGPLRQMLELGHLRVPVEG